MDDPDENFQKYVWNWVFEGKWRWKNCQL